MSEKNNGVEKFMATQIAKVHEEMAQIGQSEATTLIHVLVCGEAIHLAIEAAGQDAAHGKLLGWYAKHLPQYKTRTLQNYLAIFRGQTIVKAAGCRTVKAALQSLIDARKVAKGLPAGERKNTDTPSRTPRKRVSLDRIDLGTAIDALGVRLCDLMTFSPAERAALIGRLVVVQQQIAEAVSGLVSGKAVA